jgi:hypothetical protein
LGGSYARSGVLRKKTSSVSHATSAANSPWAGGNPFILQQAAMQLFRDFRIDENNR